MQTEQYKKIARSAMDVIQQIGGDLDYDNMDADELLEVAIDADRLETFGHPESQTLLRELIAEHDYPTVFKNTLKHFSK